MENLKQQIEEYLETAESEMRRMYGHHLRSFTAGWNRKDKFEQEQKDDFAIGFAEWLSMFSQEFEDGDLRYWNKQKDKWESKALSELLQIYKSQL